MVGEVLDRFEQLLEDSTKTDEKGFSQNSAPNRSYEQAMDSSYRNLEKLVQKYEAEIRKHVRVQQTMKIYAESLQDKLEECEKTFEQAVEQHRSRVKVDAAIQGTGEKTRCERAQSRRAAARREENEGKGALPLEALLPDADA